MILITYIFLRILFCLILIIFRLIIRKKNKIQREAQSPFECGVSVSKEGRKPISLRFFLVALIFLVFDVELTLIFPFLIKFISLEIWFNFFMLIIFLIIISIGLFLEWNQGILDWVIYYLKL